jgi:tripartite-type tricarboxylate transporter receptor subunit TctC
MQWKTLIAALACSAFALSPASAEEWPARPIKMVVPFAPAGSTDVLGRLVAQKLGEALGQPVVVENKPGAAGNIGTELVAHGPADGYTIMLGGGSNTVNANLYKSLTFDFARDLTGLAMIGVSPNVMVVPPQLPVKSAAEFVEYAKQHKGAVNYASSGNGATTHLAAELFKQVTGVQMTHVPFNGSNPALLSLMSGQEQVMFDSIITAAPMVKAGKLRALAVTGSSRNPVLPDVPTLQESGVNVEAVSFFALFAPAAVPAPILARYNTELRRIMKLPEVQARLAQFGVQPMDFDSAQLNAFTRKQIEGWAAPVRASGARID